ncbi:MAG: lysylphosphatidylglycerol synthase transmembrane domain-containing protein [Gammaproteobacteria bacterium]|nr:lysylphosphatidylglycerol synthase transmembrane domain-containing protein [Gammaproteobacteria bacterium]
MVVKPVLRRYSGHLFRIVSSAILFYIALRQVDWGSVHTVFRNIDPLWLLLHLLVLGFERLFYSYKWQILLTVKGVCVSLWKLLVITLIGKFWGTFLPSSIGVDIVRGYYLYRERANGAVIASSLLFDKVMGLFSLLLLGTIGLLGYGTTINEVNIGQVFIGLLVAVAAGICLLQTRWLGDRLENGLPGFLGERVSGILIKVFRAFLAYRESPAVVVYSFVLSILLQLIRIVGVYAMARALDIDIPLVYYLVLVPLSMILIMLPLSVGGFGLREGVFIGLFALAGMSKVDAFALGFATSLTDIILSLLGGVLYLAYRGGGKPAEKPGI